MKKILPCFILLAIWFTGCSVNRPFSLPMQTFQLPEKDFEILEEEDVLGKSSCVRLFGFIWLGDSGFVAAYKDALSKESGANALVNVKADLRETSFLLVYSEFETTVSGLPVRIKKTSIDPKDAGAYYNLGVKYDNKKLYDDAIESYTKAIQINPNYADAYYNRGLAEFKIEFSDEAIDDYTKAIQINPNYVEAYIARGIAYSKKESNDKAIDDYTKAIQINPNYGGAYYNRGLVYYRKGLKELCISDWKKAADLGSKTARQNLKKYFKIDY